MTNDDRHGRDDEVLDQLVADAMSSRGDLLPTTDAQVADAEARGVEFEGELPAELMAFDEKGAQSSANEASPRAPGSHADKVVSLQDERQRRQPGASWLGYVSAGLLGAAAASLLWVWFGSRPQEVVPLPAGDPSATAAASSAVTPPIAIGAVRQCPSPCCAGERCAAAQTPLEQCSSGRACIPCSLDHLRDSLYRLRVGSLALSKAGQDRREREKWGPLELCVRVGSSDASCVAAHAGIGGDEVWSKLPFSASAQDLAAGIELEARLRGARRPLATWTHAVLANPTLLCRGLSVTPKMKSGETLGTLSVFFEDTHYVELARGARVPGLLDRARGIAFADVTPNVYETSQPGQEKFALVVGPLDKPTAERLRWKLLDVGLDATINVGSDLVGQPRSADP